ncbi:LysR family transcriptional regulator [Pendulispora brunnea]|uniref:LysR family transcriptional regulator n=1 Tax=Pendulispora brunnea TaxID=2905690 RepID=A0ABZ2KHS7_9BACT
MDHLLAIRVFARVVEAGTFTKAAQSLQMPKATVTKLIQSLEAHLRVKLLQRTTRRVTVTLEGSEYYDRTQKLLFDLDDIEAGITKAHARPSGRLRIDAPASLARLLLIPALPDFLARYPDVRIELGVSDRPVDIVRENVDCVLRACPLLESSWVARRVAELEHVTCASPAYLKRYGTPEHPSDLARRHLIAGYFSANTGRLLPLQFTRGDERIELRGRFGVAVNDSNSHVEVALAGLGVIQTVEFMVAEAIAEKRLVRILPDWKCETQSIYAIYPSRRHVGEKVKVFVDWVAQLFAKNRTTRPRRIVHQQKQ